ncbi:MAG: ABC transporter permease subunit [Gracilibacteraceae bacterium]|jgi:arabinogalactan oligomer/maltooligosaccharide transport system permease protein|nr:ABC transporter permease subunit [Gracilibacteraceae bacterium]
MKNAAAEGGGRPKRGRAANALIYTALSLLALIWLTPIAYLVISSFRAEKGAFLDGYILPKGFTLDNYVRLFTDTAQFNYPRWFLNTLIVAVCSCIISTLFVLMTAYVLSRLRFRLRRPIMNIALVMGMFPGFMAMIAIYHLIKIVGLDKSLLALILVYSAGAGLSYYVMKGFFDTIPRALDEAAIIDGASRFRIFWQITIPLSRPIITYTVLTTFMAPWVDFILASIIMKDNYQNYTIALGLFRMLERENIYNWYTVFCAGAVVVAIPIAILFIAMQKNYVEGVTGGAVKG